MQALNWIGSTFYIPVVEFVSNPWNAYAIVGVLAVAIVWYLSRAAAVSRRRAYELTLADKYLRDHYRAMERVIDDPALPTDAVVMLTFFSEALASQEFCDGLTDHLVSETSDGDKTQPPHWFGELQDLRKSRPELVDNFFKAIGSGLAAAFLRWPNNTPKLLAMAAVLAADTRKEAIFAERVSVKRREHPSQSGIPVPV